MIIKLEKYVLHYENRIKKLQKQGFHIVGIEEDSIVLSNGKYP